MGELTAIANLVLLRRRYTALVIPIEEPLDFGYIPHRNKKRTA